MHRTSAVPGLQTRFGSWAASPDPDQSTVELTFKWAGRQLTFGETRIRPKPAGRMAPKQPDGEPPTLLFRFYEADVRHLTHPARSGRSGWRSISVIDRTSLARNSTADATWSAVVNRWLGSLSRSSPDTACS